MGKKADKWLQIYITRDYREKITMVAARDTREPRMRAEGLRSNVSGGWGGGGSCCNASALGVAMARKGATKADKWLQIYIKCDYREKITMVAARDTREPQNARRGPEVQC